MILGVLARVRGQVLAGGDGARRTCIIEEKRQDTPIMVCPCGSDRPGQWSNGQ